MFLFRNLFGFSFLSPHWVVREEKNARDERETIFKKERNNSDVSDIVSDIRDNISNPRSYSIGIPELKSRHNTIHNYYQLSFRVQGYDARL